MSKKPQPEKLPLGERPPVRIVGPAPEEVKEHRWEVIRGRFGEDHFLQLSEEEIIQLAEATRPKERYELKLIEQANKVLDDLRRDCGLDPFTVPERNIHIINEALFERMSNKLHTAFYDTSKQWIIINRETLRNPIAFAEIVLHEMMHLKGYFVEEVYPGKKDKDAFYADEYRVGLMIFATAKKSREKVGYFEMYRGLNEAIVEETAKRYLQDIITAVQDDPAVKEALDFQESAEGLEKKKAACEKEEVEDDEIFTVTKEDWYIGHAYPRQRRLLRYIFSCAKDEGLINSEEEGLNIFIRAHFTGHLVDIARLVDKTFGTGTYRQLKFVNEAMSANAAMDDLMKKRRLMLSKRNKSKSEQD